MNEQTVINFSEKPVCEDLLNALVSNSIILNEINDKTDECKTTPVVSQKLLTRAVELLVENLDLSYSDAILQAIEYFEIQLGDVKKILAPQIVDKLYGEAIKMHLVRNDSKIEALF